MTTQDFKDITIAAIMGIILVLAISAVVYAIQAVT